MTDAETPDPTFAATATETGDTLAARAMTKPSPPRPIDALLAAHMAAYEEALYGQDRKTATEAERALSERGADAYRKSFPFHRRVDAIVKRAMFEEVEHAPFEARREIERIACATAVMMLRAVYEDDAELRNLKAERDAAQAALEKALAAQPPQMYFYPVTERSSTVTEVDGIRVEPGVGSFFPVRVQMLREISEGERVEIRDGARDTTVIGASATLQGRILDWWNGARQNPRPLIFKDKP